MEKRKGLGKGLDAFFDPDIIDGDLSKKADTDGEYIVEIDVNLIDNNTKQPRKSFDDEKIRELSDSIKEHGVVQPIIVTKRGERYLIVAGERRYRAARLAGLKKVPAIVREMTEDRVLEVALIENVQRQDLNPIEQAFAIRMIMQREGLTQEQVAEKLGMNRVTVANLLRIINLSEPIQAYLRSGELQLGHAKVLLSAKDDVREKLAEQAVLDGWTVKMLEAKVNGEKKNPQPKKKKKEDNRDADIKDAEEQMQSCLGTKVHIDGNREKGKVVIEYYTPETLDEIFNLICNGQ